MKTAELAQTLLSRRERMSPYIMRGELIGEIGTEGFAEALDRRWLMPCEETGHLQVTRDATKINEMLEIAQTETATESTPQSESVNEAHSFATGHANRPLRYPITEIMAPATGNEAPTASTPTGGDDEESAEVGDDVMVAENGQTYQGKVSAKGNDGRYTISFGAKRPTQERPYGPTEVRLVTRAKPAI